MVAPIVYPPYVHETWGVADPIKNAINNVSTSVSGTLTTLHSAITTLEAHTGLATGIPTTVGPTPEQRIAILEAQVQTLLKQVEALNKRLADIPQSPSWG